MSEQRLKELFHAYIGQICSIQEEAELLQLLNDPALEETKNSLIEQAYEELPVLHRMNEQQKEVVLQQIMEKRPTVIRMQQYVRLTGFRQRMIGVAVLLVVVLGCYLIFYNRNGKLSEPSAKKEKYDVTAPNIAKATLKLQDGSMVYLDTAKSGTIARQGNMQVVKKADGEITYLENDLHPGAETVHYNTILNPKGSRVYTLTLSDGTKVWLNADASITYPIIFKGKERKVEMTGEVYFEVAPNPASPFLVNMEGIMVQVLGTHFNINGYPDEMATKVTLLEGIVRVGVPGSPNRRTLNPGQQALVTSVGRTIDVVNNVDTEEVMAWKNGIFLFEQADLPSIMRQVTRWYNVEVKFEQEVPFRFGGTIPRNVNLSDLLAMLEMTGRVHFRINENIIYVTP